MNICRLLTDVSKQQKVRKFDSTHLKRVLICCGTENLCEAGAVVSVECLDHHCLFFNLSLEFACVITRFIKGVVC